MSEWIDCKDKLPDVGVPVLVNCVDGKNQILVAKRLITKDWAFEDGITKKHEWFWGLQNLFGWPDSVTHWMPLPPPPTL